MDKEKFDQVIDYFKSNNITLPTDVYNAIEDVFNENDNIAGVQCYHGEELTDFQNDLRLFNKIDIYTDGRSVGSVNNMFTYYGQMDYSLSENVNLLSIKDGKEEVVEEITNIQNNDISHVYSPNEYEVILHEVLTWETPNKINRDDQLFIYCPEALPDDGGDDNA